jgi:hypothetical protein
MLHVSASGLRRWQNLARWVDDLRCPASGEALRLSGDVLVSESGRHRYPVNESAIPLFAETPLSADARAQQAHYEIIAERYIEQLGYPHTEEYMAYLDAALRGAVGSSTLGACAEICCGRGEAMGLLGARMERAIGVDI